MKISYLLADPGIAVFGTKGASVHVQEVVRALRAGGHQVTVFCVRRGDAVPADLADLDVVEVPLRSHGGDAAARERAVAVAAAALTRVAATRQADLVYERYALWSTAGRDLARRLGARLVVEVNAPLVEEHRTHRGIHDEAGAWAATRTTLTGADLVACVSEPVAHWAAAVAPAAAHRVSVVPNGVNTDRIRPGIHGTDGPFTVGFVGTLKPWHGTELLLEAIAISGPRGSQGWQLDICGTGPELPALQARALDLGIAEQVRFRGAVDPSRIPRLLTGFTVAVAPYPPGEHYFSPLKVYEYLAAGLPVIASAIGELPQLLDHGRAGVLVPPGDVRALGAALGELAADPDARARLGSAARALAVREHDWARRCADILDRLPAAA